VVTKLRQMRLLHQKRLGYSLIAASECIVASKPPNFRCLKGYLECSPHPLSQIIRDDLIIVNHFIIKQMVILRVHACLSMIILQKQLLLH